MLQACNPENFLWCWACAKTPHAHKKKTTLTINNSEANGKNMPETALQVEKIVSETLGFTLLSQNANIMDHLRAAPFRLRSVQIICRLFWWNTCFGCNSETWYEIAFGRWWLISFQSYFIASHLISSPCLNHQLNIKEENEAKGWRPLPMAWWYNSVPVFKSNRLKAPSSFPAAAVNAERKWQESINKVTKEKGSNSIWNN